MFWLLAAHAAGDFALQNDFMAMAKNHNTPAGKLYWPYALGSHALIHGALVALVTGAVWLGLLEAICHAVIDRVKCDEKISLHTDQYLHFICKFIWALFLVYPKS
jgi:hypothetical protein